MDAIEVIMHRRSIRKFREDDIPPEYLDKILRAAMQAPSAHNLQPWHFIVIKDRALLTSIAEFHPYAEMLPGAPAAIAVCGDRLMESSDGYLALDCAAATQNILICAAALNIGAVWLGIFPRTERMTQLARIIAVPEHLIPISLVAVGIPDEIKKPVDRYQEDRVYLNKYGLPIGN
jgi:nitroreductase